MNLVEKQSGTHTPAQIPSSDIFVGRNASQELKSEEFASFYSAVAKDNNHQFLIVPNQSVAELANVNSALF